MATQTQSMTAGEFAKVRVQPPEFQTSPGRKAESQKEGARWMILKPACAKVVRELKRRPNGAGIQAVPETRPARKDVYHRRVRGDDLPDRKGRRRVAQDRKDQRHPKGDRRVRVLPATSWSPTSADW